jgi:hypothetical protein
MLMILIFNSDAILSLLNWNCQSHFQEGASSSNAANVASQVGRDLPPVPSFKVTNMDSSFSKFSHMVMLLYYLFCHTYYYVLIHFQQSCQKMARIWFSLDIYIPDILYSCQSQKSIFLYIDVITDTVL